MGWVGTVEPATQVYSMNEKTEPSLLPRLQNEKTGSSAHEGKTKIPTKGSKVVGGQYDTGVLEGTVAGMEGIKASSRNKMYFKYLNTDKYLL